MRKFFQRFPSRWERAKTLIFAIALVGVFLSAGWLRLYGFDRPLADWHSFRQVDTASVTREYQKNGIDPLRPRYHDVSNIASGQLNLEGWRMVEFPLLNIFVAQLTAWNPTWPLVQTHRAVSIVSSLISLSGLAWLAYRWYGRLMSLLTAAIFGLMPFSVFFSRVVLPEPFMVMWAVLGLVFFDWWASRSAKALDTRQSPWGGWYDLFLLASAASFAIALLVKPMALFFAPVYFAVAWRYRRWNVIPWIKALTLFGLSVVPVYLWREWILQFPSGIPVSAWLFNGNGIRFRPAWWRWLFSDRIGRMMFGHWGAPFLIFGVLATVWNWPASKLKRQSWFVWICVQGDKLLQHEGLVLASAVSAVAYLAVFATGNVQHDYYQTVIVPGVALVTARGATWLVRFARGVRQTVWVFLALFMVGLFSWVFAWYDIQQLFNINNPAVEKAGAAVQRLTPPDSLIIANYMGDTTLLFATDRRGWPIGFEIEQKRAAGAEYYLSTALDDETRMLMSQYPVLEQTDLYTLIDLRAPLMATADAESQN